MADYNDIENLSARTIYKINRIMKLAAIQLFKNVILKTPVDNGRARMNWQYSSGGFAKGVVESNDPTGSDAISKMVDGISRAHVANGLCLTNNLPYIQVLEYGKYPNPPKKGTYLREGQKKGQYTGPGFFKFSEGGYSKQAPKGMVRISIQEIQKDLSDILDDVIDNEHGSFTKGIKVFS